LTVTVPDAFTVVVPAAFELTITVQLPDAFVVPLGPQVPPVIEPTPLAVELTVTPLAADQPLPSFFSTRTVKVCGLPTGFVAPWPIEIRASTQFFVALLLSPGFPSPVERLRATAATVTLVDALTVVTPVLELLSVTEQEPVVPIVLQLDALSVPGPLTMVNEIVVPAGAFAHPLPLLTLT
jgi:hypothetical protein